MTDAIRVKTLEWKKTPGCHYWQASTPFNVYSITEYRGMVKPFKGEATNVALALDMLCTLEEAKAACQADFARRVGECVEANTGWRDISTAPKDWRNVLLYPSPDGFNDDVVVGYAPGNYEMWLTTQDARAPMAVRPTHWQPLPPPPGEEVESERERIARELRERAEKQGDPSGWFEVIAMAIETDWSVINDPENFKNEPCRFAVMQERDALQARCDKLEAERDILRQELDGVVKMIGDPRSVVEGGE